MTLPPRRTDAQFWAIAVGAFVAPRARGSCGPSGWPDDDGEPAESLVGEVRGERENAGRRRPQERRLGGEILDRIAGERHLARGEVVCAGGDRATGGIDDELGVAGDVPDDRIRLREGQAKRRHGFERSRWPRHSSLGP